MVASVAFLAQDLLATGPDLLAFRSVTSSMMPRLGDVLARACFSPLDRRANILSAMNDEELPPFEVLGYRMLMRCGPVWALVADPVRVPLHPREGLRSMRDEYNAHDPMTLILPKVWLGSWWAASQLPMLQDNGTEIIISWILFYSLK